MPFHRRSGGRVAVRVPWLRPMQVRGRSRNGKSPLQHRVRAEGGGCPENRPRFQQLPGLGRRRRRERDRGRQGPATASARCATCSIWNGASGSGCWRYLMSSGRNLTNSAARLRCQAPIFWPPCGLRPSSTATGRSSNGGRALIARPTSAANWPKPWRAGSRNGSNRSATPWRVRPQVSTAEAYRRADNVCGRRCSGAIRAYLFGKWAIWLRSDRA